MAVTRQEMIVTHMKTKDNVREAREEEWTLARGVHLVDGLGFCN